MNGALHEPGEIVGERYAIVDFIGQGGMQEVYKATDHLLNRVVALKVPKVASAEKRFKRTAVLSARVNHANVAKTLDYLEENDRFYLIEELIDGCNLNEFILARVPRLDPYSCARVLHHLAKGLAASHHADVVHRDLKPSNVMVVGGSEFTDFKITDFGIAKMAEQEMELAVDGGPDGLTTSQTALGALPYMAPEMIEDFREATKPADIWSLGAMTFELLVGRKPFGGGYKAVPLIQAAKMPEIPREVMQSIQYRTLVSEISETIGKCMMKNPNDRPTADDVVAMCEQLCYSPKTREFGTIASVEYRSYGFINADRSGVSPIFYHKDSLYGGRSVKIGQRVWFSRYAGTPRDRAFPVVNAIQPETE